MLQKEIMVACMLLWYPADVCTARKITIYPQGMLLLKNYGFFDKDAVITFFLKFSRGTLWYDI